jgi:hypothetical protein
MKKIIAFFIVGLLFTSLSIFAQSRKISGSGNVIKQQREAADFTGISVGGSMTVKVKPGAPSVEIEAEDNLQEYITTEVKNGKLQISTKNGYSISPRKQIIIYISINEISSVSVLGSGSVKGEGAFKAKDKLDVTITGSGSCELNVKTLKTKAQISGSGSIYLSGSTDKLDVSIAGSGSFKGFEMKSAETGVAIAGSGDVETAIEGGKLLASISGSGSVLYKGNGDVSVKTAGSGRLRKVD